MYLYGGTAFMALLYVIGAMLLAMYSLPEYRHITLIGMACASVSVIVVVSMYLVYHGKTKRTPRRELALNISCAMCVLNLIVWGTYVFSDNKSYAMLVKYMNESFDAKIKVDFTVRVQKVDKNFVPYGDNAIESVEYYVRTGKDLQRRVKSIENDYVLYKSDQTLLHPTAILQENAMYYMQCDGFFAYVDVYNVNDPDVKPTRHTVGIKEGEEVHKVLERNGYGSSEACKIRTYCKDGPGGINEPVISIHEKFAEKPGSGVVYNVYENDNCVCVYLNKKFENVTLGKNGDPKNVLDLAEYIEKLYKNRQVLVPFQFLLDKLEKGKKYEFITVIVNSFDSNGNPLYHNKYQGFYMFKSMTVGDLKKLVKFNDKEVVSVLQFDDMIENCRLGTSGKLLEITSIRCYDSDEDRKNKNQTKMDDIVTFASKEVLTGNNYPEVYVKFNLIPIAYSIQDVEYGDADQKLQFMYVTKGTTIKEFKRLLFEYEDWRSQEEIQADPDIYQVYAVLNILTQAQYKQSIPADDERKKLFESQTIYSALNAKGLPYPVDLNYAEYEKYTQDLYKQKLYYRFLEDDNELFFTSYEPHSVSIEKEKLQNVYKVFMNEPKTRLNRYVWDINDKFSLMFSSLMNESRTSEQQVYQHIDNIVKKLNSQDNPFPSITNSLSLLDFSTVCMIVQETCERYKADDDRNEKNLRFGKVLTRNMETKEENVFTIDDNEQAKLILNHVLHLRKINDTMIKQLYMQYKDVFKMFAITSENKEKIDNNEIIIKNEDELRQYKLKINDERQKTDVLIEVYKKTLESIKTKYPQHQYMMNEYIEKDKKIEKYAKKFEPFFEYVDNMTV